MPNLNPNKSLIGSQDKNSEGAGINKSNDAIEYPLLILIKLGEVRIRSDGFGGGVDEGHGCQVQLFGLKKGKVWKFY